MHKCALLLPLITAILIVPDVDAQDATLSGTPVASGVLIQMTVDELTPDREVIVSVIRTTYLPGGEIHLAAGTGPTIVYVETGSLVVGSDGAAPAPSVVHAGEPRPVRGDEGEAVAGDTLILPTNGMATIRNGGAASATTLTLFSAEDARTTTESGVSHAILVRLVTLPPPTPLVMTLTRVTIEPGERFPLLPTPTVTVLAVVERSQAFSLSGNEINRGKQPIDVYVLTLTPVTARNEGVTSAVVLVGAIEPAHRPA